MFNSPPIHGHVRILFAHFQNAFACISSKVIAINLRRRVKIIILLFVCIYTSRPEKLLAQNKTLLTRMLKMETDPVRRCRFYDSLATCYLMDGNSDDSCYTLCEARLRYSSRRSDLNFAALLSNGDKWAYYTGVNSNSRLHTAENYYALLLEDAKEKRNSVYECKAYAHMASLVRYYPANPRYLAYAISADSIASILKSDSLHVIGKLALAQNRIYRNEIVEAFRNISSAAGFADEISDSSFKRQCYIQYAALYYKMKMVPEALNNVMMAFRIDSSKESYNKFALLEDYGWKAMVHYLIPDIGYQLARRDYSEWLAFCNKMKIYPTWANTIKLYIFNSYVKERKFDSALAYFKQNQELNGLLEHYKQEYKMVWATASYEYAKSQLADAEQEIRTVIDTLKDNDNQLLIEAQFDLNSIFVAQKKYEPSMQLLKNIQAQSTDMNVFEELSHAYQKLSLLFAANHDFERAYDAGKRSVALRDTVNQFKNEALFNQLRVEQEKQRTDARKQKVDAGKIRKTRTLYLIGGFLIVVLLGSCAWLATYKVPPPLIRFTVVLSFVLTFEMLSHVLHEPLSNATGDNPIALFILDLIMGAVLGAIHGWIEKKAMKKLGVAEAPIVVTDSPSA